MLVKNVGSRKMRILLSSHLTPNDSKILSKLRSSSLTNLNDRNTDKPCTPSKPNSSNDNATIMKSKMFQPS